MPAAPRPVPWPRTLALLAALLLAGGLTLAHLVSPSAPPRDPPAAPAPLSTEPR